MTPIRVSATSVEAFRRFSQADQEWMSAEDLDAQILGQSVETPAMRLGTAFGRIIELGGDPCLDARGDYVYEGLVFDGATMRPVIQSYDRRGVFELKGVADYGDVRIVAKADHLVGALLTETKTTLKAFDVEKYAHSYQWRLMADIFQPAAILYRVALLDEVSPGRYVVDDVIDLPLYPYPALHEDCAAMVAQMRDYLVARGLDAPLRARQADIERTS